MPKLDLGSQNIGNLMQQMNEFYAPQGARCRATPRQMGLLLDELAAYTHEVQKVASEEGLDADTNVTQWALDMASWQARLAGYRRALETIGKGDLDSEHGCELVYRHVTGPLLDGLHYTAAVGILLDTAERERIKTGKGHSATDKPEPHPEGHSNPKPPDVVTPFSLGNQVLVYQQFQAERWFNWVRKLLVKAGKLWDQIVKFVKDVRRGQYNWTAIAFAGGLAIAAGGAWWLRRSRARAPT